MARTHEWLARHGAFAQVEGEHRIRVAGGCRDRRRCLALVGLALVGLALLVAGCGASGSTLTQNPQRGGPASTGRATASSPTLTVTPNTGLVGGQELQLRLAGFPKQASVMVYECARAPSAGSPPGCGPAAITSLFTAGTGSASGVFTAQSGAGTGPGTRVPCRQQCVLVAQVIKLGAGPAPNPALMATAPLSFSGIATPVLADSSLVGLSWVSATDGWALAAQPCIAGTCARLAHTTDGGVRWQALPSPPVQLPDGTVECFDVGCVSGMQFASPTVGYLYGPALLMTTDGGRTWRAQPGPQVETLTIVGRQVYRVAYDHGGCPGPCLPTLQRAAIGSSAWRPVIGPLAYPDRSDAAQIVASGSTLLLAMFGDQAAPASAQAFVYRSADGGATWQRITDPCSGRGAGGLNEEEDLTDLASAPGGFFAGLCSPRSGSGTFVVTSSDGGQSWQTGGALPSSGQPLALLAAASRTTLAVSTGATGGGGAFTARLLVTTDAGRRWTTAATETQQILQAGVPAWLGFQTSQVGTWISAPRSIWSTKDGGLHWIRAAFP
jgi:hypothetical protein